MREVNKNFSVTRSITEIKTSFGEKVQTINENWEKKEAEITTLFVSQDNEELSRQTYIAQGDLFDELYVNSGETREQKIWRVIDLIIERQ